MNAMHITLNGQKKQVQNISILKDLVQQTCKDPSSIIAEINGTITKAENWHQIPVQEGDTIELLSFVGGGAVTNMKKNQETPIIKHEDIKDPLIIGGKSFANRFLLGTGKFKNKTDVTASIKASKTQIVTVALRRIDLERHDENILEYIPKDITLLTNTSGARNAKEAVRIARLARESGHGNWIKIEVINDSKYLLPDNDETIKATEILAAEGFVVLPYMSPDLYAARALVKAGAATVMPLGSLIGSNQGLKTKEFIKILIDEIDVPIVVDAGIGTPSQAAEAMEMGAHAVLANTAVATAGKPAQLAQAFSMAVEAGRLGYLSEMAQAKRSASASSPLTGFLYNS